MLAGVPVAIATLLARAMPVVIGSTLSATMNALTLPFLVTAQTLFYFDLRARKESYDVSPA